MKNRFNRLSSKEWLPFQKSWFKFDNIEKLYTENIRFFCGAEETESVFSYYGPANSLAKQICSTERIKFANLKDSPAESVQFTLVDLLEEINALTTLADYKLLRSKIIDLLLDIYKRLENRRFIAVIIPNIQNKDKYFPFAWDLAKHISSIFSIKDEKIACLGDENIVEQTSIFVPSKKLFYCLYFRKDENSSGKYSKIDLNLLQGKKQHKSHVKFNKSIPYWFILKPQPRKKDEILHPAKYPEDLVEMFIKQFTNESDNVFDPMSGTGSTQLGALKLNRNGYGTELSEFFAGIANGRCKEFIEPSQRVLFSVEKTQKFKILNKDARLISKDDFPVLHYMITSPPYWDMLNMKGAENQAKRIEKGLQTNYSDNKQDLGNLSDYNEFLSELVEIYFNIVDLMKPGSYLTIVVKNIKKKGVNFPFAWDLANELQTKLILLPEVFWCQDDISIAPYGYGNTFVSNTFHQYCLNFQKPSA